MTQLDVPNRQTTPTQHTRVLGSSFRCLDKEDKRPQNPELSERTLEYWHKIRESGVSKERSRSQSTITVKRASGHLQPSQRMHRSKTRRQNRGTPTPEP